VGFWRVRRGVVAALVLASAAAASWGPTPASAQTPPLRIAVFGDSVLLGAKEELLAALANQQVSVDAVEDRSLLGTIGLFRQGGAAIGDVVVLDLGYNDGADPAVFRGRIDDAMTALASVKRVIWLNQHDWAPGRAGMNAELAAAASRYPNLDVVDWNAEVAAHPEYVYADAIHLTPAGQPAMAALVRDHVDRYVASTIPTTTAPPTTAPPTTAPATSIAPPPRAASGPTGVRHASETGALDDRALALIAVVALLLVGGALSLFGRTRDGQRRASSSARSASGSVTGSRQANRSHT
jgi:hypothetical protein